MCVLRPNEFYLNTEKRLAFEFPLNFRLFSIIASLFLCWTYSGLLLWELTSACGGKNWWCTYFQPCTSSMCVCGGGGGCSMCVWGGVGCVCVCGGGGGGAERETTALIKTDCGCKRREDNLPKSLHNWSLIFECREDTIVIWFVKLKRLLLISAPECRQFMETSR